MTPLRLATAAIVLVLLIVRPAHGAPRWLSNLRNLQSNSNRPSSASPSRPTSRPTTSFEEDFSLPKEDRASSEALFGDDGQGSNNNLSGFLQRVPELAVGAMSGWFLMSFVKGE